MTIRKRGRKHCVISKRGRNLGCAPTRAGAEKREAQVKAFKHMKGRGRGR